MNNERLTEQLVRDLLKGNQYYRNEFISVEEQKTKNESISNLLNKSSKEGTGKSGKPEFIISSNTSTDLIIIIECKFDLREHKSNNLEKILDFTFEDKMLKKNAKKFAIDGAIWYGNFLKEHYNVISIGVSGTKENYKISKYLIKKYEKKFFTKKIKSENEIWEFDKYLELLSFKDDFNDIKISDQKISCFADKMNNVLRDNYDMDNYLKPILISIMLIAMKNLNKEIENGNLFKNKTDKSLFLSLKNEAIKIFSNFNEKIENKVKNIVNHLDILEKYFKDKTEKINLLKENKYSSDFANMVIELYENIYKIIKSTKYTLDPIGIFYGKLLKYATGEGKNLGIVLTPNHITDLFSDLANDGSGIKKNDILIDTCAGSGGFLISGYKKMISKCKNSQEIFSVKNERIFGYEKDPKMFVLAITNMILMGDGKTNFINEDSFENSDFKNKATIGFINPPYSKKKDKYKEFQFIERIMNLLRKDYATEVIAIIPLSIISKQEPKYKQARNKILRNHTLKAVISMPDDLFYPVTSVNTAIIILKPNVPHDSSKKVWMARLKDDGFIKLKHQGRVDKYNRWNIIKKELIDFYKNKYEDKNKFKYIKVKISEDKDWAPEAYVDTDFLNIDNKIFKQKIKDQISYRLQNNLLNDNFYKRNISNFVNLYERKWKKFLYKDIFDIKCEGRKSSFTIKRTEQSIAKENPGDIPYVSASEAFHGITAKTSIKKNIIFAPKITLANSGSVGSSFFQEKNFLGTDSIYSFSINKKNELDVFVGIFLTAIIELEKYRYNFGRALRSYRLMKQKIMLPTQGDNKIDFEFMRQYIKQFEYSNLLVNKKL